MTLDLNAPSGDLLLKGPSAEELQLGPWLGEFDFEATSALGGVAWQRKHVQLVMKLESPSTKRSLDSERKLKVLDKRCRDVASV